MGQTLYKNNNICYNYQVYTQDRGSITHHIRRNSMLGKKERVFGFGDLKHPSREKALKEHILTKIDKLID